MILVIEPNIIVQDIYALNKEDQVWITTGNYLRKSILSMNELGYLLSYEEIMQELCQNGNFRHEDEKIEEKPNKIV